MDEKITLKELAKKLRLRKALRKDEMRSTKGGKKLKDIKKPQPNRVGPLSRILPQ